MPNTLQFVDEVHIPADQTEDAVILRLRKANLITKWAAANELPLDDSQRLSFRFEINMDPIMEGWKVLRLEVRQA